MLKLQLKTIAAGVFAVGVALSAVVANAAPAAQQNAHHHHHHHHADKAPTVIVGADMDVQYGYQKSKRNFDMVDLSDDDSVRASKQGIVNDTRVRVEAHTMAHGVKLGGRIVINADTSKYTKVNEDTVGHETMLYAHSHLGRLEAGSTTGAYDALRTGAASIARATGGIDGDFKYWINSDVLSSQFELVTPSFLTAADKAFTANAAKVTYYTPRLAGFKAGITFIPDTDHHGTVTDLKGVAKDFTTSTLAARRLGYKNVFQGGLNYRGHFQKVTVKASVLGEAGNAKDTISSSVVTTRKDLRAYEAGASVHYMGFAVGGSYGNNSKSGLDKAVGGVATGTKRAGKYYTVGASYEHSRFGASVGYMNLDNGRFLADPKLRTKVFSVGADYKLAPGFMPYAEFTHFNMRARSTEITKNNGYVVLVGTKFRF